LLLLFVHPHPPTEPSIREAAAKVFELVSHDLQMECTNEMVAMLSSEQHRERKGGLTLLKRMDLHAMKEGKQKVRVNGFFMCATMGPQIYTITDCSV
jgi:hypothetical protein